MNRYDWVYGGISPESPEAFRLAGKTGISPVEAALCIARGVETAEDFEKFNIKSPDSLISPFLMKDMDKAVERIRLALENGEQITVYGDYDVDGITAVSSLVAYLRSAGGNVNYYIPDRLDEGYGINPAALCSLFEGGTTLVITVDTGITACKEIEAAEFMGMDIIVTDHHRCKEKVPDCCAVINPAQPDCHYPYKNLAGVGVVFKLICALENGDHRKVLDMYGDIVAMGTVADVVDLMGENRIIVDYGLKKMRNTSNVGLAALISATGTEAETISVTTIGYGLAPKINAAGRIGDAISGVNLLLAGSKAEAEEIAYMLIDENRHRQEVERQIFEEVEAKIEKDRTFENRAVLVVWGKGWHHGVIGIVASKISEKYSKPCILITIEGETAKGSGRSVHGFNLFEAMGSCPDLFIKYGGHSQAAGLTLYAENLSKLDEAINEFAKGFIPPQGKKAPLFVDFELPARFINNITAGNMERLEPCGMGNPIPEFSLCGCTVISARQLSGSKHLRLTLEKDEKRIDCIGFGMGSDYNMIIPGDKVDIAGNLSLNRWNGTTKVQFLLHDIKYTKYEGEIREIPVREDFTALYTLIKRGSRGGFFRSNKALLERRLCLSGIGFSAEKLDICLKVFAQAGLLTFVENGENVDIFLIETNKKVDLEASEILKNYKLRKAEPHPEHREI